MTALATFHMAPSPVLDALGVIGSRLHAFRARRAERQAIASLLELDPSRLDDLGITSADVRDALAAPVSAGRSLTWHRAESARLWSPKVAG